MKKMLLSAVLMGMLALGFTTTTEASPYHHNPHGSFHAVQHLPMHQPNHDNFRNHEPRPGQFGHIHTPRPNQFNPPHHVPNRHVNHRHHW